MKALNNLVTRHEDLVRDAQAIEKQIFSIISKLYEGRGASASSLMKLTTEGLAGLGSGGFTFPGKRSRRIMDRILEAVANAGADGITYSEIAEYVGIPKQNVMIWFSKTGKQYTDRYTRSKGRVYPISSGAAKPESAPASPRENGVEERVESDALVN